MSQPSTNIKTLSKNTWVALYAAIITFLTYATVYGFRKGFTVCTFDEMSFAGIDYKIWLVISQVLGYTASKFYGIRFIAELKRTGRGKSILLLTGIAWIALFFFAIVPAPWNIVFLFINGFPLGMTWGIIFSFVEGRRATDFIGAALSVSFIFSSGLVKSIAEWLRITFHLSEFWVPFVTGLFFGVPLILFVFLLEKIPPPSEEDIKLRTPRLPMPKEKRREFVHLFLPGLVTAVTIYVFSTIFRDIRDNFIADMWKEMGYVNQPALFTKTETPTTIIVLVLISSMILIKNNFKALLTSHIIIALGFVIAGTSTFMFMQQGISPTAWMTLVGLGLYMTYIPFNCVFFERMIATFKLGGNVGFLIYVADSFGYLGSVTVLLGKEIFHIRLLWVSFYTHGVIILSILGIAGTFISMIYFSSRYKKNVSTAWINVPQS